MSTISAQVESSDIGYAPRCEWLIESSRCTAEATTVLPSRCPSCDKLWHTETCDWHVTCWFAEPFHWKCTACTVLVVAGEPVRLRGAASDGRTE